MPIELLLDDLTKARIEGIIYEYNRPHGRYIDLRLYQGLRDIIGEKVQERNPDLSNLELSEKDMKTIRELFRSYNV